MLRKLVKLKVYLSVIALSFAAVATIVGFIRSGDNATTEIALPHGTLNELTHVDTFTQAYLSVNCNVTLLENTQAIRVTDRFVSGDTVWRRIRAPQHEDLFALVEGQEAAWLRQRRFFDRIISASQGEATITGIEATTWEGADCLKVSTLAPHEAAVDILITTQTMYPIAKLEPLADGTIKQTIFSDYRDIDGMPMPFKIESSVNGKTKAISFWTLPRSLPACYLSFSMCPSRC